MRTPYIMRARDTTVPRELMEIDFGGEPYRFNLSVIKRSSDAFGARPIIEIYLLDRFPITGRRYRSAR